MTKLRRIVLWAVAICVPALFALIATAPASIN
jgi:hypothetical protein